MEHEFGIKHDEKEEKKCVPISVIRELEHLIMAWDLREEMLDEINERIVHPKKTNRQLIEEDVPFIMGIVFVLNEMFREIPEDTVSKIWDAPKPDVDPIRCAIIFREQIRNMTSFLRNKNKIC